MECDQRLVAVLDELKSLAAKKQHDYGSADDPWKNIRTASEFGIPAWQGALIRGNDKMSRLKTFCTVGTLANEGVEDSLIDLANYALIALILFRELTAPEGISGRISER